MLPGVNYPWKIPLCLKTLPFLFNPGKHELRKGVRFFLFVCFFLLDLQLIVSSSIELTSI